MLTLETAILGQVKRELESNKLDARIHTLCSGRSKFDDTSMVRLRIVRGNQFRPPKSTNPFDEMCMKAFVHCVIRKILERFIA